MASKSGPTIIAVTPLHDVPADKKKARAAGIARNRSASKKSGDTPAASIASQAKFAHPWRNYARALRLMNTPAEEVLDLVVDKLALIKESQELLRTLQGCRSRAQAKVAVAGDSSSGMVGYLQEHGLDRLFDKRAFLRANAMERINMALRMWEDERMRKLAIICSLAGMTNLHLVSDQITDLHTSWGAFDWSKVEDKEQALGDFYLLFWDLSHVPQMRLQAYLEESDEVQHLQQPYMLQTLSKGFYVGLYAAGFTNFKMMRWERHANVANMAYVQIQLSIQKDGSSNLDPKDLQQYYRVLAEADEAAENHRPTDENSLEQAVTAMKAKEEQDFDHLDTIMREAEDAGILDVYTRAAQVGRISNERAREATQDLSKVDLDEVRALREYLDSKKE